VGLTELELYDVLRGAILELSRAAGIHPDPSTHPALARLAAFDREVEEGRKYEREKGQREWEQEQEDWRRHGEAAKAQQIADLERLANSHARESAWAAEQLARLRGERSCQAGVPR
jgi:uncharacterized membrane protein YccC